jgi:hypothetical protein
VAWLDPTHLMILLVAIAIAAALWLHVASAVSRAKRRRARRSFLLGMSVGWTAARIVHRGSAWSQMVMRSRWRFASPLSASKK